MKLVPESTTGGEPAGRSPGRFLKLISPLFWDSKVQLSDLGRYPDWVLERVLMFGNWKQAVAARQFYGDAAVIRATARRGVDAKTRNFWSTLLKGGTVEPEGP